MGFGELRARHMAFWPHLLSGVFFGESKKEFMILAFGLLTSMPLGRWNLHTLGAKAVCLFNDLWYSHTLHFSSLHLNAG